MKLLHGNSRMLVIVVEQRKQRQGGTELPARGLRTCAHVRLDADAPALAPRLAAHGPQALFDPTPARASPPLPHLVEHAWRPGAVAPELVEAPDGTPGECCPVPPERAPPPAPSLGSRTLWRGRGTAVVRPDGASDGGHPGTSRRRSPSPLSSWPGRCRAGPPSAASSVQEGGLAAESQLARRQILAMGASLSYMASLVSPLPAQSKSSNVPMEALKDKDYGKSIFRQVVGRLIR